MMKKFLFSLLCLIGLSSMQMANAAADIYGSLDGTTLTIYYGEQKDAADVTNWWTPTTFRTTVTKVTFDASMINARPTSTANWFNSFSQLTTIENITRLNTSEVTNMLRMFYDCRKLTSLNLNTNSFKTDKVQNMYQMFYNCKELTSINTLNFNTENVATMAEMFKNCEKLTVLKLANYDMNKVTNVSGMFNGCTNLKTIYCNDDWSQMSNILASDDLFKDCTALRGGNATSVAEVGGVVDKTFAKPDGKVSGFFTAAPLEVYCTVYNTNTLRLWYGYNYGEKTMDDFRDDESITVIDIRGTMLNYKPTSLKGFFKNFSKVTEIQQMSNLVTSEATDMSEMFYNCNQLTSLDLSSFNTAKVENMRSMFYTCCKLTSLDLSNFNTAKVTTMYQMFRYCQQLQTVDISSFDISSLTNTNVMFGSCDHLETIYNNSDWSQIDNTANMFIGCSNKLKGGNGTVWSASNYHGAYARPDLINQAGYFTYGACQTPSKPEVVGDVLYNQFTVAWEPAGAEKQWTVSLQKNDEQPWMEFIVNNTPSFTYDAAEQETKYTLYVTANCTSASSAERTGSIVINTPSACAMVTAVNITSITHNTAVVNIESDGSAWNIRFKEAGGEWSNIYGVETKQYLLTGLQPLTTYYVEVQNDCDAYKSDWRAAVPFLTSAEPTCPAPTAVNITSITHNTAVVNIESEGSAWNIRYQKEGDDDFNWVTDYGVTSKQYTLSGLQPLTRYYVQVQTVCSDISKESDWFAIPSFITDNEPVVCPAPTNFTYSNLTATSVTLDWISGGDEEEWNLLWKTSEEAGFIHGRILDKNEHPYIWQNLTPNTTYQMKLSARCAPGVYSDETEVIEFSTSEATGLFSIGTDKNVIKRIVNGQLIIEYNGKIYNAQGAELR